MTLTSVAVLAAISVVPTFLAREAEARIVISTVGFSRSFEHFAQAIGAGEANRFYMGRTPRYVTEEMVRYGTNSLVFLLPAALFATIYSFAVPLGLRTAGVRAPSLLAGLAIVPAFVVAMLIQTAATAVNRGLDVRLFTLAYLGGVATPILLPALTMFLPIVAFALRTTNARIDLIAQTDYVRAAVGRAVRPASLWFRHVGSGLLHHLDDVLPRTGATAIATLFITERVFNLPGITTLLIAFPFSRAYIRIPAQVTEQVLPDGSTVETVTAAYTLFVTEVQFQLIIGSAIALAVLYLLTVAGCRVLLRGMGRMVR